MTGGRVGVRRWTAGLLLAVLLLAGCDLDPTAVLDPPAAPGVGAIDGDGAADEGTANDGAGDEDGADPVVGDDASDDATDDGAAGDADADGAAGEGASADGSIFADTDGLYLPATQAAAWVDAHAGDARAAVIDARIADVPSSTWFTGAGDVGAAADRVVSAAAADNTVPVLVAYNVPGRDCGQYSAGGASGSDAYRAWVDAFAGAIGDRPAVVILEPDALAGMDCLSQDLQADRMALLRHAVEAFDDKAPNAWTYIDAGHAQWQPAAEMADRLEDAGIADARGFALNVSNYVTTADNDAYGDKVSADLPAPKPFVVDTSRNGNGSNGEWCNPAGRALGEEPGIDALGSGSELQLWVKLPGESDGDCGIGAGTYAGQFVPEIAAALADG